jgi:hypothetical protein
LKNTCIGLLPLTESSAALPSKNGPPVRFPLLSGLQRLSVAVWRVAASVVSAGSWVSVQGNRVWRSWLCLRRVVLAAAVGVCWGSGFGSRWRLVAGLGAVVVCCLGGLLGSALVSVQGRGGGAKGPHMRVTGTVYSVTTRVRTLPELMTAFGVFAVWSSATATESET